MCVREGARSMFSAVIGIIWLCLVKFHRARLSALCQVPLCLHPMLRRIGKRRIPSVKFQRIVRARLRSVNLYQTPAQLRVFLKY